MQNNKKPQSEIEPFQMAEPSSNTDKYFDGKKYIAYDQMTDNQLRKAKARSQRKELQHHNSASVWSMIVDKIDEEAQRRKIEIKDLDTQYHKNNRILKTATNNT